MLRLALAGLLLGCGGTPVATHPHQHGPLGRRFVEPAVEAREWDDPARDAWQRPDVVVALMAIQPGMTVADLGAGTGYFLPHLSRAVGSGGKVLALDIEEAMVRWLRDRAAREGLANVEPRLVPYDDPALLPGSVDRVLVVNTWHHIPDRAVYSAKLARGLRPGGAVFVVDFPLDGRRGPPRGHRIAPETVEAELERGGLVAETLREDLPDQYVVAGRRRD